MWAKCEGYKKLLMVKGDHVGVNKITTQNVYDLAVAESSEEEKANELAYEDIVLWTDNKT